MLLAIPTESGETVRILSLNAWGGRLHERLIPFLVAAGADVVCLQEVVRTPDARSEWLTYRDDGMELPQRAGLFEEICEALPDHDAAFCPVACGLLYHGDEPVPSQFGLATLTRRSLAVIGRAADFVHGDFSAEGWGTHPRARNAHCVRLFDPARRAAIVVAHMHGLRDLAGKGDTSARRSQAEALAALVGRVRRPDERLVVCGDFNVLPGSETFAILGRLGLVDLVTSRGFTDTRTSFYARQNRFADYLLVSQQVEVLGFDVVEQPEVSDHRPLLLDMA